MNKVDYKLRKGGEENGDEIEISGYATGSAGYDLIYPA